MIYKLPMNDYQEALGIIREAFAFPFKAQQAMINAFLQEMQQGLAGSQSRLKMLPTYMPLPSGREEGHALAVDLGGTNLRVMVVRLSPHAERPEVVCLRKHGMTAAEMSRDARLLFSRIASEVNELLLELEKSASPALASLERFGFTFSYPIEMEDAKSGRIVNLAKELTASGLVGEDPVALLQHEFDRIKKPSARFPLLALRPTALVNDTVTELIYGAYLKRLADSEFTCDIGGIIGTGNNFAIVLPTSKIVKFTDKTYMYAEMIINLESGNFDAPSLPKNIYDNTVDRATNNPGAQRLEKMIAGNYLGKITAAVLSDLIEAGYLFTGQPQAAQKLEAAFSCVHMSEIEAAFRTRDKVQARKQLEELGLSAVSATDLERVHDVCTIVAERAATAAGVNVAALLHFIDKELKAKHTVAIDGSVFGKYPGYAEKMEAVLKDHFHVKAENVQLEYISDGSGIGAAIAAARH